MPKCENCQYKEELRNPRTGTAHCYCKHPDQEYIQDFLKARMSNRYPGFIGFRRGNGEFPVKGSPKWCPLKKDGKGQK